MRLFTIGFDRAGQSQYARRPSSPQLSVLVTYDGCPNPCLRVAAAAAAERRLPPSRSRPCIPIVSLYEHCPLNTLAAPDTYH
ncbi:unnamed protein product [Danaus chrysippus]|uniref:(African queen) hypothetical protein n=1 Tax=Danaus chrysippus TaxID=151541 RepID=A0A8J2VQK5_9NEOP|nr:unnamed protein product [Danaus chrysippus]